jgi:hypothetical protein
MNTLLKDYFSKYLSASDQILNFQFSFQVKLIISVGNTLLCINRSPFYLYSSNCFYTGVVLVMCILYFLSKKVTSERSTINGYVQCYLEMAELISTKDCHPIVLRLAWSDAATYDQSVRDWPRCGGVTGSIRFDKEITHPSNAGLSKALQYLRPFRKKYRFISWSDLIQMAGSLAVELSGGPSLQSFMVYGRMDAPVPARNPALINSSDMKRNSRGRLSIGQNTSNDMLPDQRNKLGVSPTRLSIEHSGIRISGKFYSSSSPSSTPSDYLASRLPVAEPPYPDGIPTAEAHIRNTFYRMGFKNREIVALCGAHTIGRAFKDRSGVCAYASGDLSATKYTKQNSIAKVTIYFKFIDSARFYKLKYFGILDVGRR